MTIGDLAGIDELIPGGLARLNELSFGQQLRIFAAVLVAQQVHQPGTPSHKTIEQVLSLGVECSKDIVATAGRLLDPTRGVAAD
jgi:hypothetical protein